METMPQTFRRNIFLTIIGLVHVSAGFIQTVWAVSRIYIIGPGAAFTDGFFFGIFNYAYEFTPLLLIASGIGILGARRWGEIVTIIWAGTAILLNLCSHWLKMYYWGDIHPPLSWNFYLLIYYVCFCLVIVKMKTIFSGVKFMYQYCAENRGRLSGYVFDLFDSIKRFAVKIKN